MSPAHGEEISWGAVYGGAMISVREGEVFGKPRLLSMGVA